MRPPVRIIRVVCIAAVILFIALFSGACTGAIELITFANGLVPGLTVAAAMLLFRPPPRMGWSWHVALITAVSAAASLGMVADHGWVAVMDEADGGDAASPLERASMFFYVAALVCGGCIIGILTAQHVARRYRLVVAAIIPAGVLAVALTPAARAGVEAIAFLAGTLGGFAFLLAPLVAIVVLSTSLHKPTIECLQQRWLDEPRAMAERAKASKPER